MSNPKVIAPTDTSKEARAPFARSNAMSLPLRSKPNGWPATFRKPLLELPAMRLSVEFECKNIGTNVAARMMKTIHAIASHAPKPSRCERGRRKRPPGSFGSGCSSASSDSVMVLGDDASMAQPRIEDRVEDVDDDVHEDVRDRDDHHETLEHHDRV